MSPAVAIALLAVSVAVADDPKIIRPNSMKVGDVGKLSTINDAPALAAWNVYKIASVKSDYFVVRAYSTGASGTLKPLNYLVIRGLPTKDLADDQTFEPAGVWKVTETQKVELAGGGTKTLLVLEPVK